jgi:hypothetical protein
MDGRSGWAWPGRGGQERVQRSEEKERKTEGGTRSGSSREGKRMPNRNEEAKKWWDSQLGWGGGVWTHKVGCYLV